MPLSTDIIYTIGIYLSTDDKFAYHLTCKTFYQSKVSSLTIPSCSHIVSTWNYYDWYTSTLSYPPLKRLIPMACMNGNQQILNRNLIF